MNNIINKINELKTLELMIKKEEQLSAYDLNRLDKFTSLKELYNKNNHKKRIKIGNKR